MLDRLESLMRGMREVADDIAHDMRSPISRLRSRIEVTLMGPPDSAAYRDALEQTVKDADDVLAMFNALLTIALAESGAARDRFTDIDAAAVARDTAEIYEPLAEEKGIELSVDAPASLPLRGERHLLSQAIANLLDNAVKYVPRGGHVRVSVAREGERAVVRVEDDGPGIPAEFADKAFERFTRLEASRSAPGSGLGLSLVRAVAQLHGGGVGLEPAEPGLRATLSIPT
jgi:signal transduction histidine kinase